MTLVNAKDKQGKAGLAAWLGSMALAILSASCCIIPIALSGIGLGGAWLSFLGPFVAYRFVILTLVSLVIAYLWLRLWRYGTINGRNGILAIIATLFVLLAWTAPLWEWDLSARLLDYWMSRG